VIQTADEIEATCGADPSWACQRVYEWTGSDGWAGATELLDAPMHVLTVLVIAWVANFLVRRAIRRFTDRIGDPAQQEKLRRLKRRAPAAVVTNGALSLRSASRARTLAQVLRSIATITIWTIAVVMMLGELGINLGPLIAGAGIAGVAIGFGAQSLVKDFLSGMFMLIEDQYGVGDIIDAGEATGTVEEVSLRTTRLRDVNGTVWHIPNGMIERVGNKSQQWARALLDVSVAYGADLDEAQQVIKLVADALWQDEEWAGKVLAEPEVWGIEQLGPDAIVIRLVVKTQPSAQFGVMRELRRRLVDAFYREGIEMPLAQRSIWVRRDQGSSQESEVSVDGAGEGDDLLDLDGDGEADYRLAPIHEGSDGTYPTDPDDEPEPAPLHEAPRPAPTPRPTRRP
jgi:small conductance mechanosensitive channel